MFQLKIKRGEFEDLVKKMSLPTRNRDFSTGKISFLFTKIAPLFSIDPVTNKGRMQWIGKTNMATPWVRVKKLDISGITEPIRIPLDSRSVLDALASFPSKEIITFIHDTDRQEDIFTYSAGKGEITKRLPFVLSFDDIYLRESFPAKLDENGVIVSKDGLKPDIHCSCDVNIFKRLVKNVYHLNTGKRRDNWRTIDEKYHVIFNGDKNILTTIASDGNDHTRDVIEEVLLEDINGNADIYYYYGFAEVMSVLTGEIDLHALERGPLWIAQDCDTWRIRYLLFSLKKP